VAVVAYRELLEANPADGRAAYRLAVSLRHAGELGEAERWLEQAAANGVPGAYVEAERARLRAVAGDSRGALASLSAAAKAGYTDADGISQAPEFAGLSSAPGFADAVALMRRNATPCEFDPRFSDFDFWVGRWRVLDAAGNPQGANEIEKTEGGCLLIERWRGATGTTGTSMNFFDPAAGEWVQIWVSPTLQIDIRGGLTDGSMRLEGEILDLQSGDRRPFRGTWTPQAGGVVRQHFEQLADDGSTWATWFDGYYHRDDGGVRE
jgi:hypothetical protein